eukprot:MONOS_3765.1-p1 / transcript=MONOS_3765.1 / gene=MONOS_3765 / organism=Monocercomonoides_exilis_PA203 / gene_product=unspecified product / transcript_product=unspecified product / location=Mono_scaffold00092:4642-5567(+) / protein_length=290 / sequence_SO=supercontig / SO=protein_coding / is_pseudo=false
MSCLLKVALNRKEDKESLKEVEMDLLALSNARYQEIEQELYLNEIKAIIKYHQEHCNLTQLAYQSAWQILIDQLFFDHSLDHVIVNELHCAREAKRELEELAGCVDWKRKEEEEIGEKESREAKILKRWLQTSAFFLEHCRLWNEDIVELFNSIVQIFQVAKDNHRDISRKCIDCFRYANYNRTVGIDLLLESGVVDIMLEETVKNKAEDMQIKYYLNFFEVVCKRLKEMEEEGMDEAKRKEGKRKIHEKEEEEGFEDFIISFQEILPHYTLYHRHSDRIDFSDYVIRL